MVMKRITLALAVIATLGLVSCQREKNFENEKIDDNTVVFGISRVGTRASDNTIVSQATLPGRIQGGNQSFILQETVERLDGTPVVATRGIPAYTENVGTLYGSTLGVYSDNAKFGDAIYEVMSKDEDAGWRYHHNYNGDPWPDESTAVDFYFRMPANMSGISDGGFTYAKTEGKQTISFSYTTPATASAQQDILFGARSASKADYLSSLPSGVPVLLQHALSGVKFRIVNNDETTKGKEGHTQTYITKVVVSGLKSSASCVVTPTGENGKYVDITNNYSSAVDGVFNWTLSESDTTATYTQEFSEAQNLTEYNSTNTTDKPSSFYGAANTNNLNDADASMTFWFIPQEMTKHVKVKVYFHVWDGTKNGPTDSLTLKLGERILAQPETQQTLTKKWNAGELRTFSLKPDKVDVEIEDKLTEYVKSDVVIRNTGNVAMYVRVNLLGNWVGQLQLSSDPTDLSDPTVLMGHINKTVAEGETDYQVWPWNDKDGESGYVNQEGSHYFDESNKPSYDGEHIGYGEFIDLPALCSTTDTLGHSNGHHWYRFDKYYYYALPIGPGEYMAASDVIFTSYTVGQSPKFWVSDAWGERWAAKNVHLEMDVAVQSIEAKLDDDGNEVSNFMKAWAEALKGEGANVSVLDDL